jgi:uncharacterized protein YabE (DUF348 family)
MNSDTHPSADPLTRAYGTLPTLPARLRYMLRRSARPRQPRRRWRTLLIGGLITAAVSGAALLNWAHSKPVTIIVDGNAHPARTRAETVGDMLRELNISVTPNDRVTPALTAPVVADMIVRVERARAVALTVDGTLRSIWTPDTNPADILSAAGVTLDAGDRVIVDGTHSRFEDLSRWPVPAAAIQVRHAVALHVDDDGALRTLNTTADTIGEALFEAGITLYLADQVTPPLSARIPADAESLSIRIRRAIPLTITVDGRRIQARARPLPNVTVADALADAGVALIGLDVVIPDEATPVTAGMDIRVIRIREEIRIEQRQIPFATRYQPTNALLRGERLVRRDGEPGLQSVRWRIRYEDDMMAAQIMESVRVLRTPIDRLVFYGTGVPRSALELIND